MLAAVLPAMHNGAVLGALSSTGTLLQNLLLWWNYSATLRGCAFFFLPHSQTHLCGAVIRAVSLRVRDPARRDDAAKQHPILVIRVVMSKAYVVLIGIPVRLASRRCSCQRRVRASRADTARTEMRGPAGKAVVQRRRFRNIDSGQGCGRHSCIDLGQPAPARASPPTSQGRQ